MTNGDTSRRYRCLLCEQLVMEEAISSHKATHIDYQHYGLMWPLFQESSADRCLNAVPIHASPMFARILGVTQVFIRDEGQNLSGSMKDYIVERAITLGLAQGFETFQVVSSGNHAYSLARYSGLHNAKAIVFAPATSSKLSLLASSRGVVVVGVKDALFEDVYEMIAKLRLDYAYNANVSNDLLLQGFCSVSEQIAQLNLSPSHIIAGVGNGNYLAGIGLGYEFLRGEMPKIIPVGMSGACPSETALRKSKLICEYDHFLVQEETIDAAEGSIAIASYSMPQLVHAVRITAGFPLGGLTNADLAQAYRLLFREENLLARGTIPEPTGIMGLAAAMKYKDSFRKKDSILISFTGHGVKDLHGIRRLVPELADRFESIANSNRQDLTLPASGDRDRILLVPKGIQPRELEELIQGQLGKGE